jgi:hypothetical protein
MKENKDSDLHCHYSGLPSPMAYIGKQISPEVKEEPKHIMKRLIQKILLWWSFKKPKKNRKSIWDL